MERVNDQLLADEDTVAMLLNNPPDVAINAFAEAFRPGLIRSLSHPERFLAGVSISTGA